MRAKATAAIHEHSLGFAILVLFLVLGTVYSIATPIFEAGDEIWHYPFVQSLATGHSLPVQDPAVKTLWAQEGGQPPLYYAIGAALTSWIDTSDLANVLWNNPHAKIGVPLVLGNKNLIVHTSAENFPWHNTALAVHLLRWFSLLLSAGTVALTYLLALEITKGRVIASPERGEAIPNAELGIASAKIASQWHERDGDCFGAQTVPRNGTGNKTLAAVAAALVAFNPMFLFISASVNNDNLAVLLATLALVLLVRMVRQTPTLRDFVFLGVVLGLAALSKVSDAGLMVLAGVVFVYLLWKNRAERQGDRKTRGHLPSHLVGEFLCAVIVIVIAGWWYLRNWQLYGDPLAFNVWVAIAGGRPTPATLMTLFDEFEGFRISFWGNFGGVNIIAPGWVYRILDGLTLLAIVGLVAGLVRRNLQGRLTLLALWVVFIAISLVRWTFLTLASQGRLIFPAIAAIAILYAFGLDQLRLPKLQFHTERLAQAVVVLVLVVFAAAAPFALIVPTYALPPRLANDAAVPNPVHITFEDQAELVGYALPLRSAIPGGVLPLTLFWRAPAQIGEDLSVYIHLFDAAGNPVGQWDAWPGGGVYPTRLWQPGEVVVDSYEVPITSTARGPSVGRVEVGLYRGASQNLVARDPNNRIITPTIARFKIMGSTSVAISNPVYYDFGGKMLLAGYDQQSESGSIRLRLFWRAQAAIDRNYTVFVHLLDASGKTVAQKDDQPQQGAYPTEFWDAGEIVVDDHAIDVPPDLPPGDYRIELGVYRPEDQARLSVQGGTDSVILTTIPLGR